MFEFGVIAHAAHPSGGTVGKGHPGEAQRRHCPADVAARRAFRFHVKLRAVSNRLRTRRIAPVVASHASSIPAPAWRLA
jgi:hypothetical protein